MLEPLTLGSALTRSVAAFFDAEAVVCPPERVTWRELDQTVRRTAARLLATGVRHGDHVGLLMGNGVPWVTTFYACGLIGAVTVPISTRFREDELRYCLRQARVGTLIYAPRFLSIDFTARLLAVEPAMASALPGAALPDLIRAFTWGPGACPAGASRLDESLPPLDQSTIEVVDRAAAVVAAGDLLLIQYTSGTTAFPKGVMLTHENMVRNAWAVAARMGVRPSDRYFSVRPFYHVAGTTLSQLVALSTGACLVTLPTFDVARSLDTLAGERCTLASGNDTVFSMLMGHPSFDPSQLCLRGGWAAAGPEVMRQIVERLGAREICNAYGLSEASPNVVCSAWDEPVDVRIDGRMRPHDGVEVRTVDAGTCEPVPAGAPGEIQVRGWNVMRGYYDQPAETARAFTVDGWLRTGDLGVLDDDGRLRMVGRIKDVFRVGGENVAPAEVERVLQQHPAVALAQVTGVPDQRLGEVAAAYVVLRPGDPATPDALIEWCRVRSANFRVPRYVRIVESFDHIGMTGSAKVPKAALRAYATCDLGLDDGAIGKDLPERT